MEALQHADSFRRALGSLAAGIALLAAASVGIGIGGATSVIQASPAGAAAGSSCQQFGVLPVAGGTYDVQTDEWNSSATQCVSTDGNADFLVSQSSIDTGTNAPGSYPSIFRGCHWGTCTQNSGLPIQVQDLGDPTTSWATTEPTTGIYDVSYDVWFNQAPSTQGQPDGAELMIWLNHNGQVQPAGSQVGTVSLDGLQFAVWFDAAAGFNSVAYELETGQDSVSGLDLGNLVRDAQSRGYIEPSWYLIDVEAGFEIWDGGAGLATNSFSLNPVSSTSAGPATTRLAGSDAIGTAIAVSMAEFPLSGSASAVVVARSDYFADALTGSPLAASLGGPLLLTPGASESSTLDSRTLAEIQRVLPAGGAVYLVGGTLALSPSIDVQLATLGYHVQRIAGADEFATAVDIAEQMGDPSTIFEVTGLDFHDAVSAGPAAVAVHGAILLTNGALQAPETAAYLAAHPDELRYAIGGSLAAFGADPSAIGVFGPDAYGTAAAVASRFFPNATGLGIATSSTFSDALVSAPLLGPLGRPLLCVPSTGPLSSALVTYLGQMAGGINALVVFGGTAAVSDQVVSEVDTALA